MCTRFLRVRGTRELSSRFAARAFIAAPIAAIIGKRLLQTARAPLVRRSLRMARGRFISGSLWIGPTPGSVKNGQTRRFLSAKMAARVGTQQSKESTAASWRCVVEFPLMVFSPRHRKVTFFELTIPARAESSADCLRSRQSLSVRESSRNFSSYFRAISCSVLCHRSTVLAYS